MLDTVIQKIWPPARRREQERKKEFLDRLRGLTEIQIKKDLPVGVTFVVSNEGTGHVDNYFHMGPGEWISWGTSPKPDGMVTATYTTRELELHLTEQLRAAKPDGKITVLDESCCIDFGK